MNDTNGMIGDRAEHIIRLVSQNNDVNGDDHVAGWDVGTCIAQARCGLWISAQPVEVPGFFINGELRDRDEVSDLAQIRRSRGGKYNPHPAIVH
jgi:hypothetical protein